MLLRILAILVTIYQQRPPKSLNTKIHSMSLLILLAEIKVCEIADGESCNLSMFPVNFILKNFRRRMNNSSSNSPHFAGRSSTILYDPHDKTKLEEAQCDLRHRLDLDNVTIREAIRKLNSYIALNPQPKRLEVIIIRMIMAQRLGARDNEVTLWLRELEHDWKLRLLTEFRVEDMNFKDDEEHCCPICLENMAEQKEKKALPVTRMTWRNMFSVFIKYFSSKPNDDEFNELITHIKTVVSKLICGHVFHSRCIVKWWMSGSGCPVCRLDLNKLTGYVGPFLEI